MRARARIYWKLISQRRISKYASGDALLIRNNAVIGGISSRLGRTSDCRVAILIRRPRGRNYPREIDAFPEVFAEFAHEFRVSLLRGWIEIK